MKLAAFRRLAPILLLFPLTLIAAGLTSPGEATDECHFDIVGWGHDNLDGDKKKVCPSFQISELGCILAQVSVEGPVSENTRLELTLSGSDRPEPYAQNSGSVSDSVPLWISYFVDENQFTQVATWTISVNAGRDGEARGKVELEIPPTRLPCELEANASTTSPNPVVDLSWRYTSHPFRGRFLVERSTDPNSEHATWIVIDDCEKAPTDPAFDCSDNTDLEIGWIYYYRACAVFSDIEKRCGSESRTPPVRVKIP